MKFSPRRLLELGPTVSFFFLLFQLSDAKIPQASENQLVDAVSALIETGPAPASLLRGSRSAETKFETPSTHLPLNSDFERRLATLYYAGTPCNVDAQCASGHYCNQVHEVCYALLSTGSICHNSRECPLENYCNQGGNGWADGVCEPKLALDDYCNASIPLPSGQCAASLMCEPEIDSCVTANVGDLCTHDADCNESIESCTRARFGYHGMTSLGLVAEEPPTGEHIIANESRCLAKGSGLNECTRDEDCTTGRCTETSGLPAVGFCFDGSYLPHGFGAVCTFDSDCDTSQGLVCDTEKLTCLNGHGVWCNSREDCAFDRKCMIGKCETDPSKRNDCTTFGSVDGECFSLHEGIKDFIDLFDQHLVNIFLKGVSQIPSKNADGFSNGFRDVYPFLRMFIDVVIESLIKDNAICYGNFKSKQILNKGELTDHGCDMIPVIDTKDMDIGVLSFETYIFSWLVDHLRFAGRWIEPDKETPEAEGAEEVDVKNAKLKPAFCFAFRFPTGNCDDFLAGFGFNIDMVRLIGNLMGPGSTLGEMIVGITKPIMEAGISMKFGFAGAYGHVLETSVRYLSDGEYHWATIPLHVSIVTYADLKLFPKAKWLSLTRKPFQKMMDKLLVIDGNYTRSWNLDGSYGALESAVKLMSGKTDDVTGDLENLAMDLFQFAEVMGINGQISIDLASVSDDILPYITVARIRVDMLNFPYPINGVPAGFHFAANFYTDLADYLCSASRAFGKLIGRGFRCPDFQNNLDLGMSVTDNKIEYHLDVAILKIHCKLLDPIIDVNDPKKPKLVCSAGGMIWALIKKGASYIAGKLEEEVYDNVEEAIVEVVGEFGEKAMKIAGGINEKAIALAKLGSKTKKELKKSIQEYFNDGSNSVQGVIDDLADELGIGSSSKTDIVASFNFVKQKKCKGSETVELFNSKTFEESGEDPRLYFANGTGVTRLDCFRECVEYVEYLNVIDSGRLLNANPCCDYSKKNVNDNNKDYRICNVGLDGAEGTSDSRQSATTTFIDDFNAMIGLSDVGEACSNNYECNLGFCFGGMCTEICSENDRCFPGDHQICYHDDNACLNMRGSYGYCSVDTNQCELCSSISLSLSEGVYYIRSQQGNRYWYMTNNNDDNILETRSADAFSSASASDKEKYMFEVYEKPGTDVDVYMLRNIGRDKWILADSDGKVKGVGVLDPRNALQYVYIEQKDNCPFFTAFMAGSRDQVYQNDNNRIKYAPPSTDDDTLFTFEEVPSRSVGSLNANGGVCGADDDCASMLCVDGECRYACGLHFQCILGETLHHCDDDGHCSTQGALLSYCDVDTNQCAECSMISSPKTSIAEGNYRIRSQDRGLYWNMKDNGETVGPLDLNADGDNFVWNIRREPDGTYYFHNEGQGKVFRINSEGQSAAQSKSSLDDRMRFYLESLGDCDIYKMRNKKNFFVYQASSRNIKGTTDSGSAEFFTFEPMAGVGSSCGRDGECFSGKCKSGTCRLVCDASQACDATTPNHYCDAHDGCVDGYFCNDDTRQCEDQRSITNNCDDDEWCLSGLCKQGKCYTDCRGGDCGASVWNWCERDSDCNSIAFCSDDDNHCKSKKNNGEDSNENSKCMSGLAKRGKCYEDCRGGNCSANRWNWCDVDSDCVSSAYCGSSGDHQYCKAKLNNGEDSNSNNKCISGLAKRGKCYTDCRGANCSVNRWNWCDRDSDCVPSAYCGSSGDHQYCKAKLTNGEASNSNNKCISGLAKRGRCYRDCRGDCGANRWHWCDSTSDCNSSAYCGSSGNDWYCKPRRNNGQSCNKDKQCKSNKCKNKKCKS